MAYEIPHGQMPESMLLSDTLNTSAVWSESSFLWRGSERTVICSYFFVNVLFPRYLGSVEVEVPGVHSLAI